MNILDKVKFNKDGLVPAVTQDIRTDEVLMLAYMNEEALKKTIETGMAHYYSRSRQKLWLKGETSGHFQKIRSISVDCDGDTLLLKVEQTGAACHTGHHSCFFTRLDAKELKEGIGAEDTGSTGSIENLSETDEAKINSGDIKANNANKDAGAEVLQQVFDVITDRKLHPREGSYTNYLFEKGLDKILKKVGEEATEVVIASKSDSPENIKAEVADLLYHIMVLLVDKGLTLQDVYNELEQRK
jgi:phosphoribosyl-ATP pyrophosphohydrolase/phosphoribosyl-AMP cyclohydrolase